MKIKKFTATSLKEGKERILSELGDDAIILSTRNVKLPDSEDSLIEIVAAIDEKQNSYSSASNRNKEDKAGLDQTTENQILFHEIKEIKSMLGYINDRLKYQFTGKNEKLFNHVFKKLLELHIPESDSFNLASKVSELYKESDTDAALDEAIKMILSGIKIFPPLQKTKSRKIITFFGPTGTGKTSSLVKLAIVSKLVHKGDILIVSADTQKIGASEQLQTIASISSISFKSVYSASELHDLIKKEYDREFIFIDTVGRSQNNNNDMMEIREFVEASGADYKFLVLSLTSNAENIKSVIEIYGRIKPDAIVLTKADESVGIGNIIRSISDSGIPVAYISTGQTIPEDIEPASRKTLKELIFRTRG